MNEGKTIGELVGRPFLKRYDQLREYQQKHGHCYTTTEDKELHRWVLRMRQIRKLNDPALTKVKVGMLNDIGFIWDLRLDSLFKKRLTHVTRNQAIVTLKEQRNWVDKFIIHLRRI
tara:strand:+ start:2330 stop:2677 length:348 start_codon:yes stop_codon:yes gene_type:complete